MTDYSTQLAGQIPEWNMKLPRNEPLSRTIRFIGYNFTGATFVAHVKSQPGLTTSPLKTIAVAFATLQTTTWQALVDACLIGANDIPCPAVATDPVVVSDLTFSMSKADVQALPTNADTRLNSILFWDLKMMTPFEVVMFAGKFEVIPGVTA